MKNNEKFLNDLENLPDRFINEIHDSENQNAIVRKSRIHWIRPVSVAVCAVAAVAVPFIFLNTKPDSENLPVTDDKPETSVVTTPAETASATTSQLPVTTTCTSVTSSVTSVPVTTVITAGNTAVSTVIQENSPQNIPETEPQNESSEPEPESQENEKNTSEADQDKDLITAVFPESAVIPEEGFFCENYKCEADYIIANAQKLPEKFYGSISDEEALINITRKIFSENISDREGMNIVDYIEREYIIDNSTGEKITLDRPDNKFYRTEYFEDYDVWYITPERWSYKKIINGKEFVGTGLWELPPYLYVRGCDGKILAFWR